MIELFQLHRNVFDALANWASAAPDEVPEMKRRADKLRRQVDEVQGGLSPDDRKHLDIVTRHMGTSSQYGDAFNTPVRDDLDVYIGNVFLRNELTHVGYVVQRDAQFYRGKPNFGPKRVEKLKAYLKTVDPGLKLGMDIPYVHDNHRKHVGELLDKEAREFPGLEEVFSQYGGRSDSKTVPVSITRESTIRTLLEQGSTTRERFNRQLQKGLWKVHPALTVGANLVKTHYF